MRLIPPTALESTRYIHSSFSPPPTPSTRLNSTPSRLPAVQQLYAQELAHGLDVRELVDPESTPTLDTENLGEFPSIDSIIRLIRAEET